MKLDELRARLREHATEGPKLDAQDTQISGSKMFFDPAGGPSWSTPPMHHGCRSGSFSKCEKCGARAIVYYEHTPKHGHYTRCAVCNRDMTGPVDVSCTRCGERFETTVAHYLSIKVALCPLCVKS